MDILIDIIREENLSIVNEFTGWVNNYLASLSGNVDKEDISQKLENVMGVGTMFATKLKEHDERFIKQGIEQDIEQDIQQSKKEGIMASARSLKKKGLSV